MNLVREMINKNIEDKKKVKLKVEDGTHIKQMGTLKNHIQGETE